MLLRIKHSAPVVMKYNEKVAVGQMIACRKARGKSELRRAVRRVTPGQGDLKD
jgi:hypothetical protein